MTATDVVPRAFSWSLAPLARSDCRVPARALATVAKVGALCIADLLSKGRPPRVVLLTAGRFRLSTGDASGPVPASGRPVITKTLNAYVRAVRGGS